MKISWLEITDQINYELKQLQEEGNEIERFQNSWDSLKSKGINAPGFRELAESFYKNLEETPFVAENLINEPKDWSEISVKFPKRSTPQLSKNVIRDRILGGWLGRSAGCLLGKPVEKTPREGIKELLSSNGNWPLNDYVSGIGIPETLKKKYPWNKHSGEESLKENIQCMTEDDDMNYPMINLAVFEKYGPNFTTENVLHTWLELLPVMSTFTAERIAYRNALNGLRPPETALYRNPYREWIGAQIRADLWGWITPGKPALAVEYAFRDAVLSHIRNGVYGEMFFSAIISAAFSGNDIKEIINTALEYIPAESRLAGAIKYVLSINADVQSWESTLDLLYSRFGHYHWVHTINNAALSVAALLSSGNDFQTAICNVVMGGWDTDSNGATVGSVMGTMLGAKKLPLKWISPINNRIRSSLKGFDNSALSNLADRTIQLLNLEK